MHRRRGDSYLGVNYLEMEPSPLFSVHHRLRRNAFMIGPPTSADLSTGQTRLRRRLPAEDDMLNNGELFNMILLNLSLLNSLFTVRMS